MNAVLPATSAVHLKRITRLSVLCIRKSRTLHIETWVDRVLWKEGMSLLQVRVATRCLCSKDPFGIDRTGQHYCISAK